ncbi:MAG: M15 family metallopeptidase [Clostridia bacterium]|nr:M15 family metallopeptidase [Clostridia bacterium]
MNNKSIMVIIMSIIVTLSFLFGYISTGNVEETIAMNTQESAPEDLAYPTNNIFKNEQEDTNENIQYDMEDQFKIRPLTQEIKKKIENNSWTDMAPYSMNDLMHLRVMFWGFDNKTHTGELIVHKVVAEEVIEIFKELYEAKFPIDKIKLIDEYNANDNLSMEDNNTSALCVREITNKKGELSRHTFGVAIDINPVQNPYISSDSILPESGKEYLVRTDVRKGMIIEGGVCYNAFVKRGWTWGGHWQTIKDYQHFHKDVEIEITEYDDITNNEFKRLLRNASKAIKVMYDPQGELIKLQNEAYRAYPEHLNKKEKIKPYLRRFFTYDYAKKIIEALDICEIEGVLYCPDKKASESWVNDEVIEVKMQDSKEKMIKEFKVCFNNQEITVEVKYIGSQGWRINNINKQNNWGCKN